MKQGRIISVVLHEDSLRGWVLELKTDRQPFKYFLKIPLDTSLTKFNIISSEFNTSIIKTESIRMFGKESLEDSNEEAQIQEEIHQIIEDNLG